MITLKHILVPTDFSETSEAAAKYGVALAWAFNATLHLLHVEPRRDLQIIVERELVVEKYLSDPTATTSPQNAARELLGEDSDRARGERALGRICVACERSGAGRYVEIVRYAQERTIDLIVMGTHGRGFVAHMLMGSVAEKVVAKGAVPSAHRAAPRARLRHSGRTGATFPRALPRRAIGMVRICRS